MNYIACPELSVLSQPHRHATDRSVLSASSCMQSTTQQEEQQAGERRDKADRTEQDNLNRKEISAAAMQGEWQGVVQQQEISAATMQKEVVQRG